MNSLEWVTLGILNPKDFPGPQATSLHKYLPLTPSWEEVPYLTRPLTETRMPFSLPPEIFDLIVGWLCNEPTALKACCLVSTSWVPRTRRHLFSLILFYEAGSNVRSWTKAFPDPFNSPAHYTRDLRIYEPLTAKSTWVRSFHRVERLLVFTVGFEDSPEASLVQLHGLAPTLRSLCLSHEFLPPLEVFNLVCSFPLLENVTLYRCGLQSSGLLLRPHQNSPGPFT